MAVRPIPGGSDGTWGTELNAHLAVSIDTDGKIKDGAEQTTSAAPGADAELANKKYVDDNIGSANYTPTTQSGANESNGEITLPNGLEMKWGQLAVSGQKDAGWVADFSLTAFSNACFQVIVCSGKTNGTGGEGIHVYTINKDGFKLNFEVVSNVTPVRVYAIGR